MILHTNSVAISSTGVLSTNNSNIFLLFVRHKSWYNVVSLGRCSLFPSRVGLRTYQHPCNAFVGVSVKIFGRTRDEEGDRGSTVVKVLCYKSEGRWFDPSWCQ